MATRTNTPAPTRKTPSTTNGWNALLSQAIQQATRKQDPRVKSLQAALQNRQAETVLRKYGILSEVDLIREFQE